MPAPTPTSATPKAACSPANRFLLATIRDRTLASLIRAWCHSAVTVWDWETPPQETEADYRGTLGAGKEGKSPTLSTKPKICVPLGLGLSMAVAPLTMMFPPTSHNVNGFGVNPQTNPYPANGPMAQTNTCLRPEWWVRSAFKKLCSLEYPQRYFKNFLSIRTIDLGALDSYHLVEQEDGRLAVADVSPQQQRWWSRGFCARQRNRPVHRICQRTWPFANLRMRSTREIGQTLLAWAEQRTAFIIMMIPARILRRQTCPQSGRAFSHMTQARFARQRHASLHDACTQFATMPQTLTYQDTDGEVKTVKVQPYSMNRCFGDEIAFDLLERALEDIGVTDWRPDGIVLSKGTNDPNDKLSDEYFDVRDGQLYNMRIQSPALTSADWRPRARNDAAGQGVHCHRCGCLVGCYQSADRWTRSDD